MSPTISTKQPKAPVKKGLKSQASMEREKMIFLIVLGIAGGTVLIHLIVQIIFSVMAGNEREREVAALVSEREMYLQEDEENFQAELDLAIKAQEENLAAKNRAEEFNKRLAYDPEFAVSEMEKKLLKMKQISQDESIPAQSAIKQIADLATPPGSVAVVTSTEKGLRIEIAFHFKKVVSVHKDRFEKYQPGIFAEVKATSAGILRDVLAYGGRRGLSFAMIKCQDIAVVRTGMKEDKKIVDMLIVSGYANKANWSQLSREEVPKYWKVHTDNLRTR